MSQEAQAAGTATTDTAKAPLVAPAGVDTELLDLEVEVMEKFLAKKMGGMNTAIADFTKDSTNENGNAAKEALAMVLTATKKRNAATAKRESTIKRAIERNAKIDEKRQARKDAKKDAPKVGKDPMQPGRVK